MKTKLSEGPGAGEPGLPPLSPGAAGEGSRTGDPRNGEVKQAVWCSAQAGHLRTWEGYAQSGAMHRPGRARYWASVLAEMNQSDPLRCGERVLDIGCGLDTVLDFVDDVRGVTLDSLMHRLKGMGASERAAATSGAFERLPYADGVFDRVFVLNVLDHVRAPLGGLREVARVLRPGGVLVLSVDTYQGFRGRRRKLRKWYDRLRGAPTKHPWVFLNADVDRLLRRSGFEPSAPRHASLDKPRRSFWTARRV